MVAKWCGVVSSSRSQSEFPFLQKGWPAIADGVVSASRTRKMCDSKKHRRSSHNTTPSFCTSYRLCKNPPLLKKGNFAPVFLYFSHKKLCSDIPLLAEGVAAIADGVVSVAVSRCKNSPSAERGGRDSGRGSVGKQNSDCLEAALCRVSQHYPVFFCCRKKIHPFCRRGI